jgi:hypothetical protein
MVRGESAFSKHHSVIRNLVACRPQESPLALLQRSPVRFRSGRNWTLGRTPEFRRIPLEKVVGTECCLLWPPDG